MPLVLPANLREPPRSVAATATPGRSDWFTRQGDEKAYAAAVHQYLAGDERREIEFFLNPKRLNVLRSCLANALDDGGKTILNAGCGPFALEFYLAPRATIESFDLDPRLSGLHGDLVERGLIPRSRFAVANVNTHEATRCYDVVIANDILYAKALDFFALLPKWVGALAPGGQLYFDLLDERIGPIWRVFGKDSRYRRYRMEEVLDALDAAGLEVQRIVPSLGIIGGLDGVARSALWSTFGLANNFIFLARKRA